MFIIRLLLVVEVWNVKPSYRTSWTGNLLVWSDLTLGQMMIAKVKSAYNSLIIAPRVLECNTELWQIMGLESFNVVRLDLGQFLQGQMGIATLKGAYNLHIIALVIGVIKATYGKS